MKEKIVSLVSPHHDPDGRLLESQNQACRKLKAIFDTVNVSLTQESDGRVYRDLEYLGVHVQKREETGNVGERYLSALRMGLEDKVDYLFLIDFDRALHWVLGFGDELKTVIEDLKTSEGFTSYIRSQRAFETHPLTQRETERAANDLASQFMGKRVDLFSGAHGMGREVAEFINKESHKTDFGFYGEVLALPFNQGFKLNTVEVDGLEWETPDQYSEEINKIGYTQWLNNFQSLVEWEKRLTLAFEAGQALGSR
jgi:hypothetical protein